MKTAEQHEAESALRATGNLLERWHRGGDGNSAVDLMAELRTVIRPDDTTMPAVRLHRLSEGALLAAETRIRHLLDQKQGEPADRRQRMAAIVTTSTDGVRWAEAYAQAANIIAGSEPEQN